MELMNKLKTRWEKIVLSDRKILLNIKYCEAETALKLLALFEQDVVCRLRVFVAFPTTIHFRQLIKPRTPLSEVIIVLVSFSST